MHGLARDRNAARREVWKAVCVHREDARRGGIRMLYFPFQCVRNERLKGRPPPERNAFGFPQKRVRQLKSGFHMGHYTAIWVTDKSVVFLSWRGGRIALRWASIIWPSSVIVWSKQESEGIRRRCVE